MERYECQRTRAKSANVGFSTTLGSAVAGFYCMLKFRGESGLPRDIQKGGGDTSNFFFDHRGRKNIFNFFPVVFGRANEYVRLEGPGFGD